MLQSGWRGATRVSLPNWMEGSQMGDGRTGLLCFLARFLPFCLSALQCQIRFLLLLRARKRTLAHARTLALAHAHAHALSFNPVHLSRLPCDSLCHDDRHHKLDAAHGEPAPKVADSGTDLKT